MKEFFVFFIEAFLFSFLVLTLADFLWDRFVKQPRTDKVKTFQKRVGYGIWCIFVLLKFTVFWLDEGRMNHRILPAAYPYFVESGKNGIHLFDKSEKDLINCSLSQFAIKAEKFYYTCTEKENEVKVFDFDSKIIRTANSGPVLRNFNPQYYWYHYAKIDITGIILFAFIQLWIMVIIQKSRPKK